MQDRLFLSTLSLRRATASIYQHHRRCQNFYPRSPCGERHYQDKVSLPPAKNFYPRSPCGERRHLSKFNTSQRVFLSTLSLRRATQRNLKCLCLPEYFYPRSPCGERLKNHIFLNHHNLFLSTLSLRRATQPQ